MKTSRKRNLDDPDEWTLLDADRDDDDASSDLDVTGALGGLGYMPHHHARVLGHGSGPKVNEIDGPGAIPRGMTDGIADI